MLFLIGMLWFVYVVLSVTSEEAAAENLDYIPENASVVYRVDGRTFLKQALVAMTLHEDEDLSEMIRDLSKDASTGNLKPLGISFESEIAYFEVTENAKTITGFLFNLNNPRVFKKNIRYFVGKDVAISCQHNVGLLLVGDAEFISKKDLQKKADRYLSQKSKFAQRYKINSRNSVFTVWNRSKDGTKTTFTATIDGQRINFSGELKLNNRMVTREKVLKPDGLHFSTTVVPRFVSEALRSSLKLDSTDIPDVRSLSVNYYGIKIISDPEFFAAPKMAAFINFQGTVNVDTLFKNFDLEPVNQKTARRVLNIYGEKYAVVQTEKNSFGIFSLDSEKQQNNTAFSNDVFHISGEPKYLFNIQGDGLIKQLLNLSPSVQASRKLVTQIRKMDLKAMPGSDDLYTVEGYIELKQGEIPMNALFKFLIQSELLQ